ncbi:LmeA family phospholipid-binding protein [Corynebacterium auriscanis]|uniref:DUF2993 domain-containing protein n=1 Tax=Corynebacterium auriscanis TaxID=99807 RepID=A0A0A2DHY8_9CORY|nr:LmeA family phospholipid-binding protein [Corynebacterium auriscanis]KGM18820.1 hypothetical protein MA47_03935 [Corynebacterium auriscanis]WJY73658.1 hypothetical protein CAURIC_10295 [Corynebacterium auriscanis]
MNTPQQPYSNPQPSWGGQPTQDAQSSWNAQPQPQKKSKKGLTILLSILVVLLLLIALAEFGLRAYVKGQIVDGVKQQAAQSNTAITSDPKVSFGSSSLLLGALGGNIKQVDITIPSSLKISHPNGDQGTPQVDGNPEVHILAKGIKGKSESDMRASDLTMQSEIPTELMLAQAQKNQSQSSSSSNNALAGMFTLTGIKTDPESGVLDFEIGGGLAKLSMKPKAENGNLTMDVEGGKVLGFDLPETIVNSIRDSLTKQSQGGMIEGMDVTDVKVTERGMEIHMHGTDVDLAKVGGQGATTDQGGGDQGGSGGSSGSDSNQDENPVQPDRPYGSSGGGYGSSRAA